MNCLVIISSLFLFNGESQKSKFGALDGGRGFSTIQLHYEGCQGKPCGFIGKLPKTVSVDLFPRACQFYWRGILWSFAWAVHAKIWGAEQERELESQGLACGFLFDLLVCRAVFSMILMSLSPELSGSLSSGE